MTNQLNAKKGGPDSNYIIGTPFDNGRTRLMISYVGEDSKHFHKEYFSISLIERYSDEFRNGTLVNDLYEAFSRMYQSRYVLLIDEPESIKEAMERDMFHNVVGFVKGVTKWELEFYMHSHFLDFMYNHCIYHCKRRPESASICDLEELANFVYASYGLVGYELEKIQHGYLASVYLADIDGRDNPCITFLVCRKGFDTVSCRFRYYDQFVNQTTRWFHGTKIQMLPKVLFQHIQENADRNTQVALCVDGKPFITKKPKVTFDRTYENRNAKTFDFINVVFYLSSIGKKKQLNTIKKYRGHIDDLTIRAIMESRVFIEHDFPIGCFELSNITLRADSTLEYKFQLKKELLELEKEEA